MDALPTFWAISVPEKSGQFEHLDRSIRPIAPAYQLRIPSLRTGTLDDLMSLSDELEKTEINVEKTCKRIGAALFSFVSETQKNISFRQALMVGNSTAEDFVTQFRWDEVKYPFMKQSCKEIASTITKDSGEFEETFRKQMSEYLEVEHEITALEKRESGNLMLKDLSGVVKPQHLIQSEYFVTLLVVFPKHSEKEWFDNYEFLMPIPDPPQPPPIVPRSSTVIATDNEFCMATVVVLRLIESEFKQAARQRRFIVREYSPSSDVDPVDHIKNLKRKKEEVRSDLIVWSRTTYRDIFSGWIHLKVIRLFVESVLRFGLPANFCNALLKVQPKKSKPLRAELGKLYKHLGSNMMKDDDLDEAELVTVGISKKIYPYVYLSLDLSVD